MEVDNYQRLASRTLIDAPLNPVSDQDIMIVWNAIGLAGEAGEVNELIKKGVFHEHGLDEFVEAVAGQNQAVEIRGDV